MRSVVECYRGNAVRVFRLDREGCMRRLLDSARAVLERHPEVLEVRLFGSLARGEALPGSDADLLIVLADGAAVPPFPERSVRLSPYFSGIGVGCDLFAYTESELARMRSEGNGLLLAAASEGLVLARR